VIRKVLGKTLSVLASAWLAVGALTFVGLWAMVATAVPQGAAGTFGVAAWAKTHPVLEPVANALGLH